MFDNMMNMQPDFTKVATIAAGIGEDSFYTAVIDDINGFAYFVAYTSPAKIVKIRLSDFTEVATLTSTEGYFSCSVIDITNGYAYFGTNTTPGKIVKIRLSDFAQVGTLTANLGENYFWSATIDTINGYAYFGTSTTPGKIVKIRLSDFVQVGTLTTNPGEGKFWSAVVDQTAGYAYFGTDTSPANIIKIRLSDFSQVATLSLDPGENYLERAVIDTDNGFAYFAAYISPGKIIKVRLSDFTKEATLTLGSGEDSIWSAVIDQAAGFAYFGVDTSPGIIAKIRLSDFTEVAALTADPGEEYFDSAVIDPNSGFAYFGTGTSPGKIVKIYLHAPVVPITCTDTVKYKGDIVTLKTTPKDGTGPYYVEFIKTIEGVDTTLSSYTGVPENIQIIYDYILTNEDIRTALSGTIDFSVFISDSCPTGSQTCTDVCTITIGCTAPVCNFVVISPPPILMSSSWPKERHDNQNTGRSPYTSTSNGTPIWAYTTLSLSEDPGIPLEITKGFDSTYFLFNSNSATVDNNGIIYIISGDSSTSRLFAFNPDGTLRWTRDFTGYINNSPSISSDGTLVFGSDLGYIWAINSSDGSDKWSVLLEEAWTNIRLTGIPIDSQGNIYVSYMNGKFYSLDSNGNTRWVFNLGTYSGLTPALSQDESVVFIGAGDKVYAIYTSSGLQKWVYTAPILYGGPYPIIDMSSPTLSSDGTTLYIGVTEYGAGFYNEGSLFAINTSDGSLVWYRATRHRPMSSPAVGPDSTIYIGDESSTLTAFESNGTLKWEYTALTDDYPCCPYPIRGSVVVDTNGVAYFGTSGGAWWTTPPMPYHARLYAINPDGTVKWVFEGNHYEPEAIYASPTIGPNGVIYAGIGYELYAF